MIRISAGLFVLPFVAALLLSSAASAEIYRWDDENGNRHLVDNLNDVPEKYREAALADQAQRRATNNQVNIIDSKSDEPSAAANGAQGHRAMGAAPASASPGMVENLRPGGQPEMWWRQTALQLERDVSAARGALDRARESGEDDDNLSGVRRPSSSAGGSRPGGKRGRRRVVRGSSSGEGDYTEYSYERDIDQLETALDDAERAYADFHDQARRADVPAGWLRR